MEAGKRSKAGQTYTEVNSFDFCPLKSKPPAKLLGRIVSQHKAEILASGNESTLSHKFQNPSGFSAHPFSLAPSMQNMST